MTWRGRREQPLCPRLFSLLRKSSSLPRNKSPLQRNSGLPKRNSLPSRCSSLSLCSLRPVNGLSRLRSPLRKRPLVRDLRPNRHLRLNPFPRPAGGAGQPRRCKAVLHRVRTGRLPNSPRRPRRPRSRTRPRRQLPGHYRQGPPLNLRGNSASPPDNRQPPIRSSPACSTASSSRVES